MRPSPLHLRRALAAAALALAAPVAAQPAGDSMTGLSAAAVMEIAGRAEAAGDVASAIAAYTALAADPDVDIRSEARFRHARLLAIARDYAGAALLYRRILDERPDAARVRLELAATLALLGEEGAARRQLRQAQAAGLPAEVALAVNQFTEALRARRPYGASFSFALVPDSNINRATDAQTLDTVIAPLDLSEDAQAQSGIGARLGAQAFARLPLGSAVSLIPRLSGQAELYHDGRFNDIAASAAVGLEIAGTRDRLRPTLAHSRRFYGGEAYASTSAGSLNWQHALSPRAQIETTVSAARADYKLNDLQDGWLFDLSAGYERAFDARSGGGVAVSLSRHAARDPGYSTKAGGGTLLYWRELGPATLFGSAGLRRLESDERLALFPARRREWLASLSVGGTMRRLSVAGFAPTVRLGFERNASTVGLYDYSRTSVDFGITRAF
jgi:hypothetical protein